MMPIILTVGVFDYFHYGHLKLFEQAKGIAVDEYLIVAVQETEFIKKYKPDTDIFYSTETRKELVGVLCCVDEVVSYTDVSKIVKEIDFDIFAVDAVQKHAGFTDAIEYCEKNGKKVVRLQRTPNISSMLLKYNLDKEV